jgi:hypothetical protein
MSIAELLGWPEAVRTTLLLFGIALVVAPLLSGVKFGGIEIPRLDPRRRRALRVAGPLSLLAAVALIVPLRALQPASSTLRLLAVDVMENGDIDVAIRNSGTSSALLTVIEIQILRERALTPRPVLQTSAAYRVPFGRRSVAQTGRLAIRHLIAPASVERFSIHPGTARAVSVRLSLYAEDGAEIRTVVDLEGGHR